MEFRIRKPLTWMHHFIISETRRQNGYTIYKITSIGLTSVTSWKRFSDVKKLYKELSQKHRERHLYGRIPAPTEKTYFKRFDPKVIEERKKYILELLDFAGQDPVLYLSHAFVKFFEQGISPEGSPVKGGNIAAICEDLAIPLPTEIALIDPTRDENENSGEPAEKHLVESMNSGDAVQTENESTEEPILTQPSSSAPPGVEPAVVNTSEQQKITNDQESSMDYIVEAAMVFSRAAQAEANGNYRIAFSEYKAGIDKLLSGAKNDENITRKTMAKEKTCKYVARAEEIYEKYLLHQEGDEILSPISVDNPSSPIQLLERPLNYLSRYKVVRVIEGRIMQVQDVTDKTFYIMKGIRKPPGGFSQAFFLPHDVPYMVPLAAYFQSESSLFLLLKLICGGKLWDYILSYRQPEGLVVETEDVETAVEETSPEPEIKTNESSNTSESSQTTGYDSGFIDLVNDYNSKSSLDSPAAETEQVPEKIEEGLEAVSIDEVDRAEAPLGEPSSSSSGYITSFDVLSKDMDVTDLVSCSQQLLKAVSHTLEQSQKQPPEITRVAATEKPEQSQSLTGAISRPQIDTSQLELRDGAEAHPLPEGCIKRWISELIIAVDALHFNGIICGDLTMDNLLLGAEGQLMLTYFYRKEKFPNATTLTTQLRQDAVQKLYVAPERPLQAKSDFWSIGVILFEMLTRKSFQSCHPAGLLCYHEIQYPEGVNISDEAKELLDGLLQSLPEHRSDFKEIIACSFFHTIDWSDVKRLGHT
ncbi:ribosomal protein S6 kinase delta-1 isoform X2 [Malaya genurostris]|uniref:ribosomal protein S6 kinase delta-1 isoform X2 n=1 Tax=Malaya genurostris TaxID=325434 RepID=UPI0026F3AD57|nr:ribosomal protein S6 kinase delta-1 isoform X2 [Malaya genurostris]